MEANILQIVGASLALVTVFISVRMLRDKVRSRDVLLRHLVEDRDFVRELKTYQELLRKYQKTNDSPEFQREIKHFDALIQKQLALLDPSDRQRIEPSLYQSSPTGRTRFIEKLAVDASQLEHAGVS